MVLTTMVASKGGRLGVQISKVKNVFYMDGMRYDLIVRYYENWVVRVKWYERYRWDLMIN